MIEALLGRVAGNSKTYIEDVFSAYTYTGTGASLAITDNVDRTKGALDIFKSRSDIADWAWYDTVRGVQNDLVSNTTAAQTTQAQGVTATSSTGVTIGTLAKINTLNSTYVKTTFRKAPKFFDVVTWTGDGTANRAIPHALGISPGMVVTKCTSATGDWNTYHANATGDLVLNTTAAQTASHAIVTAVSATTFTVTGVANTSGATYVAYLFAHDTSVDGLIQCGSFTTDGGGGATVTLGWEPQFLIQKDVGGGTWYMLDIMRGLSVGANNALLSPNSSAAEDNTALWYKPTATGFTATGLTASHVYIYIAIRRGPMRLPTSGTQVYNAIARTGTGAAATITGVGFPPDLVLVNNRTQATASGTRFFDRLRGAPASLNSSSTSTEASLAQDLTSFNTDGFSLGTNGNVNGVDTYINWLFRRYPGVFDEVCHTGDGTAPRQLIHNLTVTPELRITKSRSGIDSWVVLAPGIKPTSPNTLRLNGTEAWAGGFTTSDSATQFTVSVSGIASSNNNAVTYVTYLFATLAGISKVFSYTGNGTSQTINCGFAAGARFVLIKRTDSTGDWYIFDSVRGIIAANDPHLSLNTTAAEVTTDDSIDPDSSGFIVNQVAATNINVNGATYIGFAIA